MSHCVQQLQTGSRKNKPCLCKHVGNDGHIFFVHYLGNREVNKLSFNFGKSKMSYNLQIVLYFLAALRIRRFFMQIRFAPILMTFSRKCAIKTKGRIPIPVINLYPDSAH